MSVTASIAVNESTPITTQRNMIQVGDVESGIVYLHMSDWRACDKLAGVLFAMANEQSFEPERSEGGSDESEDTEANDG